MADLIDRDALLAAGDATKMNVAFEDWNRLDWKTQQHILNFSRAYKRLVESAPAVDAVEVVRCKNCKHRYYNDDLGRHCCSIWADGYDTVVRDDDFCSYGERRTDATD